ncbi:hypothetical protein CJ030_MR0G015022 [Morella rubra]|uniref:Uncharacterized protein n=1 Tax=Morella rubra TaxID=262757 RepID=A0A6A1UKQ9_9ROSI|nr:hypothetical protein CJ030_MR0G015022 [Morella rubra]
MMSDDSIGAFYIDYGGRLYCVRNLGNESDYFLQQESCAVCGSSLGSGLPEWYDIRSTDSCITLKIHETLMIIASVTPSSSSDNMKILKEVTAPTGASIGRPWTRLHTRLALTNEEEKEESREPLVRKARKRARRSLEQSSSKHRGSVGGSSSSSEGKSSFELPEATIAVKRQNRVVGSFGKPTESQRQSGGAGPSAYPIESPELPPSPTAFSGGDNLQLQLAEAQDDVRDYKRRLWQLQHELQVAETGLIAVWSAGFYYSFDTLVEIAKEKFPGVDLSDLKVEDYADDAGGEVGSPLAEETLEVELGGATPEVVVEKGETSGTVPVPLIANLPSPVLEISLANPTTVDTSLASID